MITRLQPRSIRRLVLLAIVALALAPGTFVRTATTEPDLRPILDIVPLDIPQRALGGGLAVENIWHLSSPNEYFGGYSGIAALGSTDLLAVSDKGGWLRFDPERPRQAPEFGPLPRANLRNKHLVDAESIEFDPASGQIWIGYEGSNSIERSAPGFGQLKIAEPAGMRRWPGNRGPEAMARLADGRFLVIGETAPGWVGDGFPGLLFNGDPVEGAEAIEFTFSPPPGFRATDLAALADGRVIVLLRAIENYLPPRFAIRFAIGEPTEIEEGSVWTTTPLAGLPNDMPSDNFEGLAAIENSDGSYTLWLISDDNGAVLQRTLLYRLRWDPAQTAR
ncbi:esterase-like activity of phytase family protein [Altererythrobacter arenosus]|uniref:Esterase-like activity of phytase family protein n=1 Tax=Altererythrobacter arenosus TaxID=3032592 RepID=A0ABY8FV28_9SPHN|nr:esterase-like activity of phytase family protein [Altererythrobacter sp. CAU 1644]WFL78592.1 esterase-like activity of phytase family protein [Altererythrobacter sp. CAU 1644]